MVGSPCAEENELTDDDVFPQSALYLAELQHTITDAIELSRGCMTDDDVYAAAKFLKAAARGLHEYSIGAERDDDLKKAEAAALPQETKTALPEMRA